MLAPRPARSVCGGPVALEVHVDSHCGGRSFAYAASPGCGWPRGTEAGVYGAAARRDVQALALYERRLRCDHDPVVLAAPTRDASIAACTHGRWSCGRSA